MTLDPSSDQYFLVLEFFQVYKPRLVNNCGWCSSCNRNHGFEQALSRWASGDDAIDQFILSTQLSSKDGLDVVEWIPFETLMVMEKIEDNSIYEAIWKDGPIKGYNMQIVEWERTLDKKIALKKVESRDELLHLVKKQFHSFIRVFI